MTKRFATACSRLPCAVPRSSRRSRSCISSIDSGLTQPISGCRARVHTWSGTSRVCVSDTVGHATPDGAAAVVRFIDSVVADCGGGIGIDWHGHRDRDFAVINTLAALDAGATRLHGTAIGIGERVGNTPMDLLLVNLVLMGYLERDLSALGEYCETVSAATGVPIPANYPV